MKKTVVFGDYVIAQDKSSAITVYYVCDSVRETYKEVANAINYTFDDKEETYAMIVALCKSKGVSCVPDPCALCGKSSPSCSSCTSAIDNLWFVADWCFLFLDTKVIKAYKKSPNPVKADLRTIAGLVGYPFSDKWNTHQFGSNLIDAILMMVPLTAHNISLWDRIVAHDPKYGPEAKLISAVLNKSPMNTNILEVAVKISLIDLTNSTQLSKYKSKLSLFDIAKIIIDIKDFDDRVASGKVSLVNDLASKCKKIGGINLFSFATKYCFYHNRCVYNRCDYSIFDSVVSDNLYRYATRSNPLRKNQPEKWREDIQYHLFHEYIGKLLDDYGITESSAPNRREEFDHFLWFMYK